MGILDWLKQALRKWAARFEPAPRYESPRIVAHYWDGGAPKEHQVRDISLTGAYLYATEHWCSGTIIEVALQELAGPGETTLGVSVLCLRCKVVRHGPDGIGITFMLRTKEELKALKQFMSGTVASASPHPEPAKCRAAEQGQSLVEYAFMVPFLVLLIVNCVNFGAFIYDWIEVANAARAGVQYAVLSGASAPGGLTQATGAFIAGVITADMSSLPGTPTIAVCENNNGVLTTLSGTCSLTGSLAVPADPEAPLYILATVDVTYTYVPLTKGALSFPKLGINATIPPTSIHRRAEMRVIQ
jgi:Flp pilus assembly protein TadG